MLVSSMDYNDFVGRIGIGRMQSTASSSRPGDQVCNCHNPDLHMRPAVSPSCLTLRPTAAAHRAGRGRRYRRLLRHLPDITIGNTMCDPSKVEPLPFVRSTILPLR